LVIDIFLKKYLNKLGFKVSTKEAEKAEFRFWSVFEDGTDPRNTTNERDVSMNTKSYINSSLIAPSA
jgi:hypothetical protein